MPRPKGYLFSHCKKGHDLSKTRVFKKNGQPNGCGVCLKIREAKHTERRKTLESYKTTNKNRHFKRKYGITLQHVQSLSEQQNHACFICLTPFKDSKDRHVDHCHKTNKIRKLLCRSCNHVLGFIERDIKITHKMLKYLTLQFE